MEANVDELELHEEHLESGEGNGWLGEGEADFYIENSLVLVGNTTPTRTKGRVFSPGWYYQPGLIILATPFSPG
jgi:hypothetical protein